MDGAGAPPAGPRPGAEASQSTANKYDELRRRYREAREQGELPYGWLSKLATELGIPYKAAGNAVQNIRLAIEKRERAAPRVTIKRADSRRVPDYVAGEQSPVARSVDATKPDTNPVVSTTSGKQRDERPELAHTETPACWCRKKPASRDNLWCKLRKLEKPASQHAALKAPEPRVRRMVGTRY